jgi:hypothetical protein
MEFGGISAGSPGVRLGFWFLAHIPRTLNGISFKVAEVSAFDPVTTLDTGHGSGAVSIDASGNYLLTYTASDAGGDTNIHSRRGRLLV